MTALSIVGMPASAVCPSPAAVLVASIVDALAERTCSLGRGFNVTGGNTDFLWTFRWKQGGGETGADFAGRGKKSPSLIRRIEAATEVITHPDTGNGRSRRLTPIHFGNPHGLIHGPC